MATTVNGGTKLVAQVDAETRELIDRAAELSGLSPSQFLVYAATKEATRIKEQALHIHISQESADKMQARLDNPEPLSPKLREAARSHREMKSR